jgi:transcriptional regulator GlxA family with amidase domain
MRACIVVFDGVDELDFVAPLEILRRAAKLTGRGEVELVTVAPQEEVVAAHGLRVRPDGPLGGAVDLLVVPGGGWTSGAARGVRAEVERGELPRAVAALHAKGTTVAAVCTGAMALARAGLLGGRQATTHHGALDDLRAAARLVEARVVDDGDVVTCGGVTAGLDLALWLVERFWGREAADHVARAVEHERSPDVSVSARTTPHR